MTLEEIKRAARNAYEAKNFSEAVRLYREGVKYGDGWSMYNLALCYGKGEGVEENNDELFHYLTAASETLIVPDPVWRLLGVCHETGCGTKIDIKKAIECYQEGIRREDPRAKVCMDKILHRLSENAVQAYKNKDYTTAVSLWSAIADHTVSSYYNLAICYSNGLGTEKNIKKAIECYQMASEKGNPDAAAALRGLINNTANEAYQAKNYDEAARLWREGVQLKDGRSCFNLGICYATGRGVEKDYTAAFQHYKLASEILPSMKTVWKTLGEYYEKGIGTTKDIDKAIECYTIEARNGDASVAYRLGNIFFDGTWGAKDYRKAVEFYTQASNQGIVEATTDLGVCYINGWGVTQDAPKAVELFSAASEKGNVVATMNLASSYFNGNGVPKDVRKAFEYYTLAADKGQAQAMMMLGVLLWRGKDGIKRDKEKAWHYFEQAYEQGDDTIKKQVRDIQNEIKSQIEFKDGLLEDIIEFGLDLFS